jgi:hypothetical protein
MSAQGLLPARSSATATGVALGGSSRVVSPVARRLSRSSSIATTPATGSSSRITTGVAPAAAIILALRLGAASTTVSVVGAVGALDTAPVLGLVALLGDVALVTAVVASTTSTAAASTSTGLGAVGLVVADNTSVKLKGMRDSIERDG